jgi:hypothetical protein
LRYSTILAKQWLKKCTAIISPKESTILPLTPEILIELIDPLKSGKKQKRHAITNDELIIQSNLLLVRWSKDYAYATRKEYLEDLLALL